MRRPQFPNLRYSGHLHAVWNNLGDMMPPPRYSRELLHIGSLTHVCVLRHGIFQNRFHVNMLHTQLKASFRISDDCMPA